VTLFLRVFIFKSKMVVRRNRKTHNRLPQKKRRQWNVREKLMIVHYFENNGSVRGTAKRFNIQPKQLRDWKNKKQNLLATSPHVIKLHLGKPAKYPKLEDDLFAWISEKRANGNAVTQKFITSKAISLSKSPEFLINNPGIVGFKFSSQWLDGFLGRYDLSNRRRTTVAQKLPSELIEIQNIFLSYVMYLRIHNKYQLKYIGNMDETPL
jgi:transposase-like protein